MLQPEAAGVIPFAPVSWYGVASPCAVSGLAGTMMAQDTLAAATGVVAVAVGVAVAGGHGVGVADALAVGVAVADAVPMAVGVAGGVGAAVTDAVVVAVGVAMVPVGVGATVDAVALDVGVGGAHLCQCLWWRW